MAEDVKKENCCGNDCECHNTDADFVYVNAKVEKPIESYIRPYVSKTRFRPTPHQPIPIFKQTQKLPTKVPPIPSLPPIFDLSFAFWFIVFFGTLIAVLNVILN